MLYAFVLGIGLMIGLAFLIPWLTQVEPKQLLRVLKWMVFGLLSVVFFGLLLTGRMGWALAALAGMTPWLMKLLRIVLLGRVFNQAFGNPFGNPFRGMGGNGGAAAAGGTGRGASEVVSRYLRMTLDLASGTMTGTVIAGRLEGRPLDSLSLAEALDLRAEVAADTDSQRLLDTWLDRAHPGWEEQAQAEQPGAGGGRMDRTEALRVLGLDDGADEAAIKAAYRHLMAQAHPDRGGSAWMAAKLNEARDVLLRS